MSFIIFSGQADLGDITDENVLLAILALSNSQCTARAAEAAIKVIADSQQRQLPTAFDQVLRPEVITTILYPQRTTFQQTRLIRSLCKIGGQKVADILAAIIARSSELGGAALLINDELSTSVFVAFVDACHEKVSRLSEQEQAHVIAQALHGGNEQTVMAACKWLKDRGAPFESVPFTEILLRLVDNQEYNPGTRIAAIWALGELNYKNDVMGLTTARTKLEVLSRDSVFGERATFSLKSMPK